MTETSNRDRLQELVGLITQGEWSISRNGLDGHVIVSDTPHSYNSVGVGLTDIAEVSGYTRNTETEYDAEFIALARNELPALLEELAEAQEMVQAERTGRKEIQREYLLLRDERDQAQEQVARLREVLDYVQRAIRRSEFFGADQVLTDTLAASRPEAQTPEVGE